MIPILSVRGLTKVFEIPKREPITAVSNVTFDLAAGTALGVVGDSGCGKSTLVRLIMRLMPSTAGTILLKGHDITHLNERALREVYRTMQMVFSSLRPRLTRAEHWATGSASRFAIKAVPVMKRIDALPSCSKAAD